MINFSNLESISDFLLKFTSISLYEKCDKIVVIENMNKKSQVALPDDPIIQFYYLALGIVIIYILFCLMNKQRRK